MNTLYIDTRNNKQIIVCVIKDGEKFTQKSTPDKSKTDVLLVLITEVLKESGLSYRDLHAITCEKGPGSFTGLRVGFAVANALSLALLIPLNDNELGTIDTPVYS